MNERTRTRKLKEEYENIFKERQPIIERYQFLKNRIQEYYDSNTIKEPTALDFPTEPSSEPSISPIETILLTTKVQIEQEERMKSKYQRKLDTLIESRQRLRNCISNETNFITKRLRPRLLSIQENKMHQHTKYLELSAKVASLLLSKYPDDQTAQRFDILCEKCVDSTKELYGLQKSIFKMQQDIDDLHEAQFYSQDSRTKIKVTDANSESSNRRHASDVYQFNVSNA